MELWNKSVKPIENWRFLYVPQFVPEIFVLGTWNKWKYFRTYNFNLRNVKT